MFLKISNLNKDYKDKIENNKSRFDVFYP